MKYLTLRKVMSMEVWAQWKVFWSYHASTLVLVVDTIIGIQRICREIARWVGQYFFVFLIPRWPIIFVFIGCIHWSVVGQIFLCVPHHMAITCVFIGWAIYFCVQNTWKYSPLLVQNLGLEDWHCWRCKFYELPFCFYFQIPVKRQGGSTQEVLSFNFLQELFSLLTNFAHNMVGCLTRPAFFFRDNFEEILQQCLHTLRQHHYQLLHILV